MAVTTVLKIGRFIPVDGVVINSATMGLGSRTSAKLAGVSPDKPFPDTICIKLIYDSNLKTLRITNSTQATGGYIFSRPYQGKHQRRAYRYFRAIPPPLMALKPQKGLYLYDETTDSFKYAGGATEINTTSQADLKQYEFEDRTQAVVGAVVSWPYQKKSGGLKIATGKILDVLLPDGKKYVNTRLQIRPLNLEYINTLPRSTKLVTINILDVIIRRRSDEN